MYLLYLFIFACTINFETDTTKMSVKGELEIILIMASMCDWIWFASTKAWDDSLYIFVLFVLCTLA